jgi:hypothetical protein
MGPGRIRLGPASGALLQVAADLQHDATLMGLTHRTKTARNPYRPRLRAVQAAQADLRTERSTLAALATGLASVYRARRFDAWQRAE